MHVLDVVASLWGGQSSMSLGRLLGRQCSTIMQAPLQCNDRDAPGGECLLDGNCVFKPCILLSPHRGLCHPTALQVMDLVVADGCRHLP
jgi:hypothetical protein